MTMICADVNVYVLFYTRINKNNIREVSPALPRQVSLESSDFLTSTLQWQTKGRPKFQMLVKS